MAVASRCLGLALLVAACGDNLAPAAPYVEEVGHSALLARGMNAALAVAGDTVYVGSRADGPRPHGGVLIVDVHDPRRPTLVGEIGAPEQGLPGVSSRELRAVPDLDLLLVLDLVCSPDLHGCASPAAERDTLRLYDIADRHAPVLVGSYQVTSSFVRPRGPHEMFLWRDPAAPRRVLLYLSTPPGPPSLEVVDVSDPTAPTRVVGWDPVVDGGLPGPVTGSNLLHSVAVSRDGRRGYLSHLQGGLAVVDTSSIATQATPALALLTPPAARLDWSPPEPAGPHSAVEVPGRDLLVVTDEVYPIGYGAGCPWGWLRLVDVADPAAPRVVGEFRRPENDGARCAGAGPERVTFTAHDATATAHLALVTWHGAGLEVLDTRDPAAPRELARFLPEPLATVDREDPALGGTPVLMWSYPVIAGGLIYVVDIRNGLYVLRYHGELEDEILTTHFAEGNSNLE